MFFELMTKKLPVYLTCNSNYDTKKYSGRPLTVMKKKTTVLLLFIFRDFKILFTIKKK